MSDWERFNNRILSISPAEPGWHVRVELRSVMGTAHETEDKFSFPILTWALVESVDRSGASTTQVEPVFLDGNSPTNSTEYRRMHSNVDPDPGEPKELVSIEILQPEPRPNLV
ncbi:hypothetical protein OG257_32795 [Streptomyces sp. NBC_00683]|uniref:hypothetical protein n=1 Tax=Streptomyces sp. NBC_00683 TaxID=2903670 RepID=UPI002E3669F9|nr:hypothetical protein [Streptomyces sp. NBC_00683]